MDKEAKPEPHEVEYWVSQASKGRNVARCWQEIFKIIEEEKAKAKEQAERNPRGTYLIIEEAVEVERERILEGLPGRLCKCIKVHNFECGTCKYEELVKKVINNQ